MTIIVFQFPCLEDNYGYLIHDPVTGCTATIDSPDPVKILTVLEDKKWELTHIFNTHHHWDHTDGNLALKAKTGCMIIGPSNEKEKIPGIDRSVKEGDEITFGTSKIIVHDTPGHTLGHVIYHIPDQKMAFVGDTLFSLGCGRLFEGTPDQMWASLQKLMRWPDETKIYCAHEYTQANAAFALTIEPNNQDLLARCVEIDELRSAGKATIPTSIGLEKKTNPFLRPSSLAIREGQGMQRASDAAVFARVRTLKDNF